MIAILTIINLCTQMLSITHKYSLVEDNQYKSEGQGK